MSKYDLYLYDDCKVLKNKFDIKDEKKLDEVESALASTNMMALYDSGFSDFPLKVFVNCTRHYLAMCMIGQGSTELLIFRKVKKFLPVKAYGILIGIVLIKI